MAVWRLSAYGIAKQHGPVPPRTFHDEAEAPRHTEVLSTFPSPPTCLCRAFFLRAFGPFYIQHSKALAFNLLSKNCLLAFLRCGSSLWAKRDRKHCHYILYPAATHQRASARGRVLRLGDREPRPGHIRYAPFASPLPEGSL